MLALDQLHFVLVFFALLGSGLIAGVFFAFSTFVMNALSRLPSGEGIAVMQSINISVLNRWFLGVFLGTAVVCILLLVWSLFLWDQMGSGYLIAGSDSDTYFPVSKPNYNPAYNPISFFKLPKQPILIPIKNISPSIDIYLVIVFIS